MDVRDIFSMIAWGELREEIKSLETVRTEGNLHKVFGATQAHELRYYLSGAVRVLEHLQECAVKSGVYSEKEIYGYPDERPSKGEDNGTQSI